jgi:nucleoside-diphosphate-sugar epimerase
MNIAVLGAHGKSGLVFVEAALEAGHSVRAGIRGANPFHEQQNLTVMQCDATDALATEQLVADQDVVVSLLGHRRGTQHDVQSQAMQTLINLHPKMTFAHVITLTGSGVRMPGDKVRAVDYLITYLLTRIDPQRMKDGAEHVALLQKSPLNFTVLRVFKLTGGALSTFSLSASGPVAYVTSRKTAAAAILRVLGSSEFIRQAPMVCRPK